MNWGPRPGYPLRDLNRRDDWTWEPVRKALGYARAYSLRMDLASAMPHNDLASTNYCLANPEREFLVYLPEGDQVSVDLSRVQGKVTAEWMHSVNGAITAGGTAPGGKRETFAVPFEGPAVLYLKKENG